MRPSEIKKRQLINAILYPQIDEYETELHGEVVTIRVFEPVKTPEITEFIRC